ncbi:MULTISPECIES: hypothetical protein [Photorhabdus]|uniref:Uncharacterized protein n=2 Tax=Photorhabdus asymbiotica TaxID=291112 RepID=B6VL14_PHOAA|nr:hypothetical protein [Photorhabdus asymbiotica]RKS65782.1 hypothetical protein BDD30_0051 [Photorhabdus asymbiotica]CAQ84331.1 conserved hypothetical protein [Photorhabdus asymbiotica]CAR66844.1 Conserved Hypothetical Protein [Photorhabdus asymbiotica subsp. asymbiotica ATCC 43949]
MTNYIIIDGDLIQINPKFEGDRTLTINGIPKISGNGDAQIEGKNICVSGDHLTVSIPAIYITSRHPVAGSGKVKITNLSDDQLAEFCVSGDVVIIEGSQFEAQFTPDKPATNPSNQDADNPAPSNGSGRFIHSQNFVKAEK